MTVLFKRAKLLQFITFQPCGHSDIKIAGLSDYSFDNDFNTWNGGNILEITCKNKNYEPESDTDIDE